MYCTRNVTEDLIWVGADDRRLAMFEGVYSVPGGVSYNSYLLMDEKTVLFNAADSAVEGIFLENIKHALNGRELDYVVVQHMEPDHSATLRILLTLYPEAAVVCNGKALAMIRQFFGADFRMKTQVVAEGDTLSTGKHTLAFRMAPMVHWPEVMVAYDQTDRILFSADAFGTFGALNGALFADEVDFFADYLKEARRYYANIVGKYGNQVQSLLKKAAAVEIDMICPLHGFVWRKNIGGYLEKYRKWSRYEPEVPGILIAYGSIYGNTENAANILACMLRERGVRTAMYDVSVTDSSEIVAEAFAYSHLVFASATYNAGIFISMDQLLRDLAAHNLQKRTVALMENGTWAPVSGSLMREIIGGMKEMRILEQGISIRSSLADGQLGEIESLAEAIAASVKKGGGAQKTEAPTVDPGAFFKLSYGLFVLTAREGERDNGCIINTVGQLTDSPKRIQIAVSKQNLTHDMIQRTGMFNVSVLTEEAPFRVYRHFGFQSGRDVNKFAGCAVELRSENGLLYLPKFINAFFSGKVTEALDYGTHTLFVADVIQAQTLSEEPSATYEYYFAHVKPKPAPAEVGKKGFVCRICGYVYEGETLPEDFICPLCKHGAEDFEVIGKG